MALTQPYRITIHDVNKKKKKLKAGHSCDWLQLSLQTFCLPGSAELHAPLVSKFSQHKIHTKWREFWIAAVLLSCEMDLSRVVGETKKSTNARNIGNFRTINKVPLFCTDNPCSPYARLTARWATKHLMQNTECKEPPLEAFPINSSKHKKHAVSTGMRNWWLRDQLDLKTTCRTGETWNIRKSYGHMSSSEKPVLPWHRLLNNE